jgi:hypothetical protein
LATLIQIRRDTQANWTANDPVLASGEIAFSTDQNKIKIGNGSSLWSQLDYINVLPSELDSDNISEGTTNLFFTPERAVEAVAGGMFDTDVVEEGTVNLYFTEQRAIDAVAGGTFSTDVVEEGTTNLYYTDARVEDVIAASDTDDLSEGSTNLYFTDQRAVDAVVNGSVDTDDIEEGTTNLYYTDARVEDVIAASDTDDLSEGSTNLYFTDSRARSAISGSTGITYSSTDGVIFVDTDEIATVEYVNATAEGLHVHTSVATATTANIADLSSPPATIDGVTLTEGMRVLVKNQETLSENGIYVVEDGALVRAEDYDTAGDILAGDFVFVSGGDTQIATGWVQVNEVSVLGTDPIVWTQFIGAGVYTAGEGLDLNGSVFSLDATTDLVDEGTTNLYFTDQRAVDAVINGAVDTDDIEEGTTNLYYTDARVEDVIVNSTTDDLGEGTTNLYFTNQRAIDAVVENISVDDLSDVDSSEPEDGDILIYSTTTQTWTPGVLTVIDGGTP